MPVPTWVDGNPLPASDVNSWFVPKAVYKTADETVTSSAALQNDDHLFLSVEANAVYHLRVVLMYMAATGGDIAIGFTMPAGATNVNIYLHGLSTTAAGGADDVITAGTTAPGLGGISSSISVAAMWESILTTAGTAGTLRLQWAQATSFGTATTLQAGSLMILQRIA